MAMVDPEVVPTGVVTVASSELFDPCFLTVEMIDDYIKFAASSGAADDLRFAIFGKPLDWSQGKDRFPLPLCEFLAYKTVLAYESDATIREHFRNKNCRGISEESYCFFDSSPVGDTQGFGFVIGDTAFIVMRGSASLRDWIDDLTATMTDSSWVAKKTRERVGGADPPRHLGFARAWANVSPKIEDWVRALPSNVRQFCFSGHSLGGALAIIGAHDFARRKDRKVAAVVTFAAPKVGGEKFTEDYKDAKLGLSTRTLRLESDEDAVPWLALGQYSAVGTPWLVDKRPMIGGWEKLWAGLLGIAGWTRGKATRSATPSLETEQATDKKPGSPSSASPAKPTAEQEKKPAVQVDPKKGVLVILAIVAVVIVFLLTRKMIIRYRAHGVAKRYALYLTTLSYRRIRELRITDPTRASDADYKRASDDFSYHLNYIRALDSSVYNTSLKNRPIRILTKKLAEKYAQQTGENGGYERYVW